VPRLVAPRSLVVLRRGTLSCRTLSSLATLYWAHARVHLSAIALPCVFCGFVAPFPLHSAEGKFGSAEVRPKHFGLLDPGTHSRPPRDGRPSAATGGGAFDSYVVNPWKWALESVGDDAGRGQQFQMAPL
jgi:hypothetical protein